MRAASIVLRRDFNQSASDPFGQQGPIQSLFLPIGTALEKGEHIAGLELAIPGTMAPEEYDEFVRDTTNFLVFIAEPMRSDRRQLGVWVLIYLLFFLIIAVMLKKQIWKDVK